MSLRIAVQMDPLESINPAGDTTFMMIEEAQRRGSMASAIWPMTAASSPPASAPQKSSPARPLTPPSKPQN